MGLRYIILSRGFDCNNSKLLNLMKSAFHHSSQKLNFELPIEVLFWIIFSGTFFWLMPIMGIDILQFTVMMGATNIWGIFNHTKLIKNMGFFEYILATPRYHCMHHDTNVKYLDKNWGQVLIIWDNLFGTFYSINIII